MAARPYGEWQLVDWVRYVGEFVAFLLLFITFCILCGSVSSSGTIRGCIKNLVDGKPVCDRMHVKEN